LLVGVTAARLEGVDLVVVAGARRLSAGDRQRLMARARQRGAVLLAVGRWPGAELEIDAGAARWQGLGGGGAGRLRCRDVRVRVGGRGAAHRVRTAELRLPGSAGAGEEGPGSMRRVPRWRPPGVPERASDVRKVG
jgi:hypothetical protein